MRRLVELVLCVVFVGFAIAVLAAELYGVAMFVCVTWRALLLFLLVGVAIYRLGKQAKSQQRLPPGTYRIVFDPVSHRR